jgi:diaminopimelate decarboxylase
MHLDPALIHSLAQAVGTPFWLYDAAIIRRRIRDIQSLTASAGMQARYAMKACSVWKVLEEMKRHDIWIDAVSGNEVLRALRAGHPAGQQPPAICFTADVFRDNALEVILAHGILPNIGSPGMVAQLHAAGYRGAISIRLNPGFGHGHVNACDTGGPSSKHGIWPDDIEATRRAAEDSGMRVVMLHAHIGSGPQIAELKENLARLAHEFAGMLPRFPDVTAINLGGGIPHNYRDATAQVAIGSLQELFATCREELCRSAHRDLRLEIEPGRYYVAPGCALITRVADVKMTRTNEKGRGEKFAMVDAGFVDLVRPAMYGSFHRIELVRRPNDTATSAQSGDEEEIVVAGPLCESGDVFSRDEAELLVPRKLPRLRTGDLLAIRDAGAYGYSMSSNYNSLGRAPQLWLDESGEVRVISRRETVARLTEVEADEPLDLAACGAASRAGIR